MVSLTQHGGLVVTRRVDEQIVIHVAGQVIATVQVASVDSRRRRAQLRVVAPPAIDIDRAEVYHQRLDREEAAR